MGNKFYGEGNLGKDPELTPANGDKDAVCNFRIYFDKPVPVGDDQYEDKGGFWMNVEIWGKRAVKCHETLVSGNRVTVDGSIILKEWTGEGGEEMSMFVVRAKRINPDIMTVETLKERKPKQ